MFVVLEGEVKDLWVMIGAEDKKCVCSSGGRSEGPLGDDRSSGQEVCL